MRRLLLVLIILLSASGAYAKSARQYQKEIEKENQSLKQLKKTIDDKKAEKERIAQDEKKIKAELSKIEKELARLQKQREVIRKKILATEKNLTKADNELKAANLEKNQWIELYAAESRLWFRAHKAYHSFLNDIPLDVQSLEAIRQKKSYIDGARIKEENSKVSLGNWRRYKTELMGLKAQQENSFKENELIKAQKQKLLGTTVGKRIVAENEIKGLVESARALEDVIFELVKKKKQTEQDALARKSFAEKKNKLPWPVEGKVITAFGKNKHPELDTFIISNGIKIRSVRNNAVKPVSRGEVIFSGEFRAYGLMIIVDHGGGFYTIYGLLGEIAVEEKQKVREDTVIGKIAGTGDPDLYFEVRSGGKPENPLLWLR
ncbi:MAG TPA: hypothetical protein DEE98_06405 [Elusimicrobia bacterium]|nr:MAG: hypothetical protein A2278_02305 [Elusimicrobia bacterium RIFOXYA12_FULL_49_49]OGS06217.1 MAG: hypothetical protein A2204_02225 [Elusimicrobia bacterium RIFOXYA1_FULL_47_7]OGS10679.1 MAG: hypothetical protein A2386_01350 [Elusimicrobia bacterium RIFOXYB1_FULL_48_9]OGS16879.1 MAG: hypothetical protein A2251_05755 [Elusimicrobia bacterium RIFOXYA2_FULL_47_53]OGS32107.1 MAG: hypothetical protein A2323_08530 [Elusimicrobia bacterium RIFOXYB2_FULL_46_23]HBU70002.1 hypothetical protein [Elus